jgi:large subunit ribosomal protein L24
LSARARIALNDADAGAVFGNDSLNGRLSVQGEVEGTGRSPAAVIGSLAGYGSVTLDRAQIVGVNPGVFSIVERAVELGIPSDGDRIRQFVTGVLDTTKSPVTHATAGATVIAGMARFDEIVVPMAGSELKAGANLNLGDGGLDALLTLTGQAAPGSRARPALLIGLTGPVLAPKRTIDTTLLTNWLTLLTVEQHSKQIDAMEKAAREMNPASKPIESNPEQGLPDATAPKPPPSTALPSSTPASAGGQPSGPPPAATPPAPKPRAPVRSENSNPRGGILSWPRALFGAQN